MENRDELVKALQKEFQRDILIIGGGATGLGIAVDAASRGYSTILLEAADFSKGTSSRSTKLVHGGVRYLEQGNIQLVFSALKERGRLRKNASHLVKKQSFVIPCYSFAEKIKYLVGLKIYDWLSVGWSFGSSRSLSKKELLERLPNIRAKGLVGGVEYFDGQFDDARLAITLMRTAIDHGAVLLNYFKVKGFIKENGKVAGVTANDVETGIEYHIHAKVIVNATGVFVDDVLKMDEPEKSMMVRPSQGVHIVIDRSFLPGDTALLIPKTPDGRVLFAVPWHQHLIVGTTDNPVEAATIEPVASGYEIMFILDTVKRYLSIPPDTKDILSVFAGLRPLVIDQKKLKSTRELSRDHKLTISQSGMITITGGKWTTYRKMAQDTVNKAISLGNLPFKPCHTFNLPLHAATGVAYSGDINVYGTDDLLIKEIIAGNPALSAELVKGFPETRAEVVWAVRNEMARTIEDVLARRLRILFLNARMAISAAPLVAELMSTELNRHPDWKKTELEHFIKLAEKYIVGEGIGSPVSKN